MNRKLEFGRPRKAAFLTLGCKVNQYETDAMEQNLKERGYEIVDFREKADVYVINTCTVTGIADRKSRQMIRRARRNNPDSLIVAAGCYVQSDEERLAENRDADILIGNTRKDALADILDKWFLDHPDHILKEVEDMSKVTDYESLMLYHVNEHTRAYVKIQDGCNQFCSYCIIPYVRGRIRSKKPEEVVREIETLVQNGYREIVLTGIHLSSYGKDLDNMDLIGILEAVSAIEGIGRIRLGSLEPRIITEGFLERLVQLKAVCPHFHLSLQSGCDTTLKRMNRHYTTEEYEKAVELLRKYYKDPAVTTDVIAGFVGETEEEFSQTENYLEKIKLYEIHVFKYSVREGTRAQKMEGHLPEHVKAARVLRLMDLTAAQKKQYEEKMVGGVFEVLLEEEKNVGDQTYFQGYTANYVKVLVKADSSSAMERNRLVPVKIEGFLDGKSLFGKISIEF